jgi:hypothetical protein
MLYLLLAAFASGGDLAARIETLGSDPMRLAGFVVIAAILARAIFAVAGGRVMGEAAEKLTGRSRGEGSVGLRHLRLDLIGTPGDVLTLPLFVLLVLAGLLQLTRIPYAGRVLLFVLLPVFFGLSYVVVRPIVRWLLAGHLIGAGIATEPANSFPAQTTALAFLSRDGLRVTGLRLLTFLVAVGAVLLRAAAVAFLWLVLQLVAPGVVSGEFGRILGVVALWWLASLLLAGLYAGRVGQYVVLRRTLDGVPIGGESPRRASPGLEEIGVSLVKILESLEEE